MRGLIPKNWQLIFVIPAFLLLFVFASFGDSLTSCCIAPTDTAIACYDPALAQLDLENEAQMNALFGIPSVPDACSSLSVIVAEVFDNRDNCGIGQIVREFVAINDADSTTVGTCQQVIAVYANHDYKIKFPKDEHIACTEEIQEICTYEQASCDLLAISQNDEYFGGHGTDLYRIARVIRVINWCEYDGFSDPVIVSRDEDCDGDSGDEDIWVIVKTEESEDPCASQPPYYVNHEMVWYDRDDDPGNFDPPFLSSYCDNPGGYWKDKEMDCGITSTGYWEYYQFIFVESFGTSVLVPNAYSPFCSEGPDCAVPVSIAFTEYPPCALYWIDLIIELDLYSDGSIDESNELAYLDWDYHLADTLPPGEHTYHLKLMSTLSIVASADLLVTVADCNIAMPDCPSYYLLQLESLPPGTDANNDGIDDPAAAFLDGIEFLSGVSPDCSEPVSYALYLSGKVDSGLLVQEPGHHQEVITCNDFDEGGTTSVYFYIWDNADNPYSLQPDGSIGGSNYDFCEILLLSDNNSERCAFEDPILIPGNIYTEEGQPVEGVTVALEGPNTFAPTLSDEFGEYSFWFSEPGDYMVMSWYEDVVGNGVSTQDLIKISKHILGVVPLDSPYKMIAADVNRTGSITTLDMIRIKKVILGILDAFPDCPSWQFIDASYEFPDPADPWLEDFPVFYSAYLDDNILQLDFIGIKTGDVNGSAVLDLED